MLRVYRIPFSTNVERVALALGHKGIEVEWVDVDPAERSPVEEISGQPLVPVLVADDEVVVDSTRILRWIEDRHPEPALWPNDEARRAELDVFLDWFDRVWKVPPNAIEAERAKGNRDTSELERELAGSRDLFERMLSGRAYLYGDFSAADCVAFPFLKYGLLYEEDDEEEFHVILRRHLELAGRYPMLEAWIRTVDEHPRT